MVPTFIFMHSVYIITVHNTYFCYSVRNINAEKSNTNGIFPHNMNNKELQIKKLKIQKYEELRNIITQIRKKCGNLCGPDLSYINQDITKEISYRNLEKIPNCSAMWNISIFDQASAFKDPIQTIPKYLKNYFSYDGRVKISPHYLNDTFNENHVTHKWGK
jgi:hypothetical protein